MTDPRFGAETIADWWFEVWNEPNEGRFWQGTTDDYFALYRATAEAVDEAGSLDPARWTGHRLQARSTPDDGPPWMERFLRFIAANPELRLRLRLLHRKGTVGDDPPDPRRLDAAAAETASQAIAIDARRFAGLTIWNNEADEKVGFEVPYAPRTTNEGPPGWPRLLSSTTGSASAIVRANLRFAAAADNANLQLVQSPFDGRRSIMTRVGTAETDSSRSRPTASMSCCACSVTGMDRSSGDRTALPAHRPLPPCHRRGHPRGLAAHLLPRPGNEAPVSRTIEYIIDDLPWPRVNVARFQIDRVRSNAYTAAGGSASNPFPSSGPGANSR